MESTRAQILVVEDNPADQLLFQEGVSLGRLQASLHFVDNGIEALRFLRRAGPYGKVPRPDVILLDFNLPRKDGREVLAEIKADRALTGIPVLVFSTSNRAEDVATADQLGAASYLTKPSDLHEYQDLVQGVVAYCFRLPGIGAG